MLLTVIVSCCTVINFRHLVTEKRDNITWLLALHRQLVKSIYKTLLENCLTMGVTCKYHILTSQLTSEQKNKCLCDHLFVIQSDLFSMK